MDNTPLYHFGFGLSYSKFEYSNLRVNNCELIGNDSLLVSVDVRNISDVKGKEVVQMYIQDVRAEILRPNMELKGFKKIELLPNETKTVTMKVTPDMLEYSGIDMKRRIDNGEYIIYIGGNSNDLNKISFNYYLN